MVAYGGAPPTPLNEFIDGQLVPVEYEFFAHPVHGPSIHASNVYDNVSICFSSGHMYMRPVDIEQINLERYAKVQSQVITVINEDLPYLALIYHGGVFYNLSASLITGLVADTVLVNLASANHKLNSAKYDSNLYQYELVEFMKRLDEYVAPPEVKLDTAYGKSVVKLIVENLNLANNPYLKINKINAEGAFGKIYTMPFVNDKFILKYQEFRDETGKMIWEHELLNSAFINTNLIGNPALPYTYTLLGFKCGQISDISSLDFPSCPSSDDGEETVGVFVQEYINSVGTLIDFIRGHITSLAISAIVEAVATLAEAHQGDTVQHHFMHLDAHGKNFLVVYCDKSRNCDSRTTRTVDFGELAYSFGQSGFRVYLIDYGFSHFLDSNEGSAVNSDLNGITLGNQLYPAIDLIILLRHVLSTSFADFVWEYTNALENVQNEYYYLRQRYTNMLKISALMLAEQIVALVKERVREEVWIVPKRFPTHKYSKEVELIDLDRLSHTINDKYDKNNLVEVQLFLADYIDQFAEAVFSLPPYMLDDTTYNSTLMLLTGMYVYMVEEEREDLDGIIEVETERLIRKIYQKELKPLPDELHDKLGLPPAPPLSGIPLYMWYLQNYDIGIIDD